MVFLIQLQREHPITLNVQNIDLSCKVVDLGLEFEILTNLSILGSYKRLMSKGLDYLPIRNEDFSVESFNAFQCDLVHEINSFEWHIILIKNLVFY